MTAEATRAVSNEAILIAKLVATTKANAMHIQESVHRILGRQEALADLFYLVFLDDYPEVRQYFEGVDLQYQAVLLTMALLVIERHYTAAYPATKAYLKYLGTKHQTRGVPEELFPHFRDALLVTLEQFHGSDWDAGLARQWKEAIDGATETMLEGYRQHFSV
jgi:hemoglobin-like flavoprotein